MNTVSMRITATLFSIIALAGCGGRDRGKSSSGGTQPLAAPTIVYIWAASPSTDSDGNYFTGPAVANAFCAAAAQGMTFNTPVNTHWGMVAFPTSEPSAFFSTSPAAQRPDGTAIVADYSDFFTPSITAANSVGATSTWVWTGLDGSTGLYAGNTNACQGWTSDSSSYGGNAGVISATNANRFGWGAALCDSLYGIYCVSFQN